MKPYFLPFFLLLMSCEETLKVSVKEKETHKVPSISSGILLHTHDSDWVHEMPLSEGVKLFIPGRVKPGMENGVKVFAGWCESVPCERTSDLTHLVGMEYEVQGVKNLYALWLDPSEDWESGVERELVIPNGVLNINDNLVFLSNPIGYVGPPLDELVIADSVINIGAGAFATRNLSSVVIPNSVTSIGLGAFILNDLSSVVIPNSVTSIGDAAFLMNRLTSVVIPDSVLSIGDEAFSMNKLTSVVIANSVTSIGKNAFARNELTSVVISHSMTIIESFTFSENKLTSVVIPNSVTIIERGAFEDNPLGSVTIGANVVLENSSFPNEFDTYYDGLGKLSGTYLWDGVNWSKE